MDFGGFDEGFFEVIVGGLLYIIASYFHGEFVLESGLIGGRVMEHEPRIPTWNRASAIVLQSSGTALHCCLGNFRL